MATVKLEYIFIEKEKHESKTVKMLIEEIMKNVSDQLDNDIIKFDNDKEGECIKYRIVQRHNSNRCYLEMETVGLRINKATERMQKLDIAFSQSPLQRYYYYIKEYDGISESFCIRLYPKYARFERKLCSLILLVLTKAYGGNWKDETIAEDMLNKIKEVGKGNITLSSVLENMDLATLEEYLFEKREPEYSKIVSTELSAEKIKEMSKDELCIIIEKLRATSLWDRNFNECGDGVLWEERIKSIHNVRNKVAHQKTITEQEYKKMIQKLNLINRELDKVVFKIKQQNYTEYEKIDILGSFALVADKMRKGLSLFAQIKGWNNVVLNFHGRMQEIMKPLDIDYGKIMGMTLKQFGSLAGLTNVQKINSDAIKKFVSIGIAEEVKSIATEDVSGEEEKGVEQ